MTLHTVILAAGQGSRMRSALPKVLHPIAGSPMLSHVIDAAEVLAADAIHIVVGHGGEQVRQALESRQVHWVEQRQQLGTGHAVLQALPGVPDDATVLVLYGDVPLVQPDTLRSLLSAAARGPAILTVELEDPDGYGRILRSDKAEVLGIVEQKDANRAQLAIREINTGLLAAPARLLERWLRRCGNDNAQGEYYLTDVVALAVADGLPVESVMITDALEVSGVNNRAQLAQLERVWQYRTALRLMQEGVTLRDPARLDVRGHLHCAQDVTVDVNCVFEGEVSLAEGVTVGPGCVIRNSRIGAYAVIEANSVIDGAEIGARSNVGPFARLRPGTVLHDGAKVGNFVEIKKSEIGPGSKVNHLSYIGDATLGRDVNVGAGTITCNYDGTSKHHTVIEDGAFIGSDTQLVAPVTVGTGAVVGAGTTVTRDVEPGSLALSRTAQKAIPGWKQRRSS
ncbi:MAG: bifunctional UDP-N-acetylglucosamine diphosphorylase/glucosamine-1-phosphate N-acetyltransferase GlmU [Aquisalimonadaceae bacterium]